ncbi:MAG: DUF4188 domain-containing protein [Vulcanimicrobiaceae bacterium]
MKHGSGKSDVYLGRYTAEASAPFVVFLIGMRFNTVRGLPAALRTFFAMPKMLAELAASPELGLLGHRISVSWPAVELVQYWRSFDELERYARDRAFAHLGFWRWFNELREGSKGVGIWHETYLVEPGRFEAIYANMPRFGLAEAMAHRSLKNGSDGGARARIAR